MILDGLRAGDQLNCDRLACLVDIGRGNSIDHVAGLRDCREAAHIQVFRLLRLAVSKAAVGACVVVDAVAILLIDGPNDRILDDDKVCRVNGRSRHRRLNISTGPAHEVIAGTARHCRELGAQVRGGLVVHILDLELGVVPILEDDGVVVLHKGGADRHTAGRHREPGNIARPVDIVLVVLLADHRQRELDFVALGIGIDRDQILQDIAVFRCNAHIDIIVDMGRDVLIAGGIGRSLDAGVDGALPGVGGVGHLDVNAEVDLFKGRRHIDIVLRHQEAVNAAFVRINGSRLQDRRVQRHIAALGFEDLLALCFLCCFHSVVNFVPVCIAEDEVVRDHIARNAADGDLRADLRHAVAIFRNKRDRRRGVLRKGGHIAVGIADPDLAAGVALVCNDAVGLLTKFTANRHIGGRHGEAVVIGVAVAPDKAGRDGRTALVQDLEGIPQDLVTGIRQEADLDLIADRRIKDCAVDDLIGVIRQAYADLPIGSGRIRRDGISRLGIVHFHGHMVGDHAECDGRFGRAGLDVH